MSNALQAFQQFFTDLWHLFASEWLPVIEAKLLLFWQWLLANPVGALGISAVLLLWACLVIRKSTHDGWSFVRVLLVALLLVLGFAALAIVVQVA
jgi:hypothetical protein